MKTQHQQHLADLLDGFVDRARAKYVTGQKEHGGNLWEKPHLIDEAMDECIDQWIYLYTLKQQLNHTADYPFEPLGSDLWDELSENEA